MVSRRQWLRLAGTGILACSLGPAWGQRGEGEDGDDAMVVIPAGLFLMGTTEDQAARLSEQYGYHVSWLSGEVPQRTVELPAYALDVYPVTTHQYAEFCRATGHAPPPYWHGLSPPDHLLDHPAVGVNHADASAYALWAGKRLPSEAEWEKAARGTDGRLFPWGDEFDPDACQWNRDRSPHGPGTAPASGHPRGVSPYGVMDLVGNAAEWCADGPGPGSAFIKGGCYLSEEIINLRPAARNMSGFANNPSSFYGFRCARDVG